MKWSLQITYRNVKPTATIEEWIRDEAEKLDNFYSHILACRVAVEVPHHHHRKGGSYHIRIDLRVPGGEIVVNREPSLAADVRHLGKGASSKQMELNGLQKHLRLAIKSAFRTAEHRLQNYARCQRGEVKLHAPTEEAFVSKIVREKGYGFLTTNDGRGIYFHQNSVLDEGFSRLELGTTVSFVEESGEKGPQASTVRIIEEHRNPQGTTRGEAVIH
jgi:cold shock CspA family protein